jgi:group I intron endonuclease
MVKRVIAIYKLTSPTGKVYIGQSHNVHKRHSYYRQLGCDRQPKLYASLKKHGFDAHSFEIITEFPPDVEKQIVSNYEMFCISQYKEAGIDLLNLTDGGEGHVNPTDEARAKLSKINKGRVVSEEERIRLGNAMRGKRHTEEMKAALSARFKGRVSPMLGKKQSDECKRKVSEFNKGRKRSAEAKANMSAAQFLRAEKERALKPPPKPKVKKKRVCSEETKRKISEKIKGIRRSEETIAKLSARMKGRKPKPGEMEKMWEARRKIKTIKP